MDTPVYYEICWKQWKEIEVVDSTNNMEDAEYLAKEYRMAFGNQGSIFIR